MSLASQMARDVDLFLNTADGAETVTYTPAGGVSRQIDVDICQPANRQSGIKSDEGRLVAERQITVTAKISATEGVLQPKLGDQISRGGRIYSFVDEAEHHVVSGCWQLIYQDVEILNSGPQHRFRL